MNIPPPLKKDFFYCYRVGISYPVTANAGENRYWSYG